VTIRTAYDRSGLIERAIATLKEKLIEESIVVALVTMLFLFHLPSALVAIITLPVAILMAFIIMYAQGINANIMSLGGIAIAIGAMIDAAIIMIENAHKHLERDRGKKPHWQIIRDAATEVGPTLFYSLLVITVSFVPVFTLTEQAGRLFKPLAFTKTYAMGAAAFLSITLVPVLMGWFIRGKIKPEQANPAQPAAHQDLSPAGRFCPALAQADAARWPWSPCCRSPGRCRRWARNSCRRSMRATFSTCRPPCRGCR
jgi:copper/silver efflux system protein